MNELKLTRDFAGNDSRYVSETDMESTLLELFRDPCCLLIANPYDQNMDPHQCSNCHQIFCKTCCAGLLEKGHACPICRHAPFDVSRLNAKLKGLFELLRISCRNKSLGCKVSGKLVDIQIHEKTCDPTKKKKAVVRIIEEEVKEEPLFDPYDWIAKNLKCNCSSQSSMKVIRNNEASKQKEFYCNVCCSFKPSTVYGVLTCPSCNIRICYHCAESIKEEPQRFTCKKAHLLSFGNPNFDHSSQHITCRLCRYDYKTSSGFWSCQQCEFNVCSECCKNPFKCSEGHLIYRRTSQIIINGDSPSRLKENSFRCCECETLKQKTMYGELMCTQCKTILCDRCAVNSRKDLHRTCDKGHTLMMEQDLTSPNLKCNYPANDYKCDRCSKLYDVTGIGVLHCDECEFDLCKKCAMK